MAVAGTTIRWPWTILDQSNLPLTGMTSPADITFTLFRDSGAAIVAATEIITFVETATAGTYSVSFTPQNSGLYTLQLQELNANSLQRIFRAPDFLVQPAGAVFMPSYANAYCSEADIEAALGLSISSATSPNDLETIGYAQGRADFLESICAAMGSNVTPATITPASRLEGLMRRANAVGAAIDFLTAQGKFATPLEPGKLGQLQDLWVELAGGVKSGFITRVVGQIETEVKGNLVSLATDHILSGDTLPAVESSPPTDIGIPIRMGDVY